MVGVELHIIWIFSTCLFRRYLQFLIYTLLSHPDTNEGVISIMKNIHCWGEWGNTGQSMKIQLCGLKKFWRSTVQHSGYSY